MARRVFTVAKGGSHTPEYRLRRAAEAGDAAQVRELLGGSVEVNAADPEGRTALHLASAAGHLEIVEALVAAGAQVDVCAEHGETPLLEAATAGHAEVVAALVRAGADVRTRGRSTYPPLHVAVQAAHEKVISVLLSAGAPVDARGWKRRTALFYAVTHSAELVRTLLAAGARADARTPEGDTPLHSVARAGDLQALELLLSAGARVDPVDASGLTPLAVAAMDGHLELVERLLRSGAAIDGSPLARATPRFLAEAHGRHDVARLLAERGGAQRKHSRGPVRKPVRPRGTGREPLYSAFNPWLEGSTLELELIPAQAPTLGSCTGEFIQDCLTALGYPHVPESWSVEPIRSPYHSPNESSEDLRDRHPPAWLVRVQLAGPPPELDNVLDGFPAEVNQPDSRVDYQATHRLILEQEDGVSFLAVGSFAGEVPPTVLSRIDQRLRELGVQATVRVRAYEKARFQLRILLKGLGFPQGASLTEEVLCLILDEGGVTHWRHEALLTPY